MAFLKNRITTQSENVRGQPAAKYHSARMTLILVIICSLINIFMTLSGSDRYFLFSAFIPYYLTFMGALLCGKMPDYWYEGEGAAVAMFEGDTVMLGLAAVSAVILIAYLVLWFLSKKPRMGIMIAALVLFSVDTAAMLVLGGISFDMLLDYLFHAYVIYSLASGITALKKLRELPPEPIQVEDYTDVTGGSNTEEGV